VGGVEYFVKSLAELLAKNNNDITVLSGDPTLRQPYYEEINKVNIVRWPTLAPNDAYHIPKLQSQLMEFFNQPFDVVHTHSIHSMFSIHPLKAKKAIKCPWKLVMTMHNSTLGYTLTRKLIWKLFWKEYLNRYVNYIDVVHSTSVFERENISKIFPEIASKITTIPLGVDEDISRFSWTGKDSDYLLYSGRLENYKRIQLILDAFLYIVKNKQNLRLMIMGSGPAEQEIIKHARARFGVNYKQFIIFSPPRPRAEYLSLLSKARAAISVSVAENFNIFLMEANAIGVPIIATRKAAAFCPSVANVESVNPIDIAETISKVLSHDLGACGKYAHRNWQEIAVEFEQLYNHIVAS
jgi:1,2-diacylglycerol 3-alpha-glucosyltransferase